MRPRKPIKSDHDDFFLVRLRHLINLRHELALLADRIDWDRIDEQVAPFFSDKGRPAESTRFIMGMLLLKSSYKLSDEQV